MSLLIQDPATGVLPAPAHPMAAADSHSNTCPPAEAERPTLDPALRPVKWAAVTDVEKWLADTVLGKDATAKARLEARVRETLSRTPGAPGGPQLDVLFRDTMDEIWGFGPIQQFIDESVVSEIMVNRANRIYVERKGKPCLTNVRFDDDKHTRRVIDKILTPLGRFVDEHNPLADARLPDGSRVNVIIPPSAIAGPCITIRKFGSGPLSVADLIKYGTMTQHIADFLRGCVIARLNIVVSGGTGSGKTTLLNALSSFIPHDERIVTIEDAAELKLVQDHVISLESSKPDIHGKGGVSIRDLVKNSLRMRPERIVVGECRGGEALDMLQAMNTGHDGSLTTLHANTPRDALSRIETMALMAGIDFPIRVVREQIASAVHLFVQQARLRDGSRRITHITEMGGMEGEKVVLQELFNVPEGGMGPDGKPSPLRPTGLRPRFTSKLEAAGIKLPAEMFRPLEQSPPSRR